MLTAINTLLRGLAAYTPDSTTNNYSFLTTDGSPHRDAVKTIILSSATSADKIFTLPSLGSDEDGYYFSVVNESDYKLTLTTSDSDSIWNSGAGKGIELPNRGTSLTVRYDHSRTTLDLVEVAGGRVVAEGLALWMPLTELTINLPDLWNTPDFSGRHMPMAFNTPNMAADSEVYWAELNFDGTDEYIQVVDAPEWDVFASVFDDWTIMCRAYFDGVGATTEALITQYEDASNYWYLFRNASAEIAFKYANQASGTEIDISGSSLSATTWYDVVAVKIGPEVGLYIGAVGSSSITQVAYDTAWTADTFTGSLFVAQNGQAAAYYDGTMNDVMMINQNIFNAAPNSTPDDTITIPTNLNLVRGIN